MANAVSRHLNAWQLASLERLGDLYIPGTERLPAFSQADCLVNIDVILDEVDPGDVALMALLLTVLRCVPRFVLQWMLTAMDQHQRYPEWIAGLLRLMSLALKGVVMSLYYSGLSSLGDSASAVYRGLGYELHCEPDAPAGRTTEQGTS